MSDAQNLLVRKKDTMEPSVRDLLRAKTHEAHNRLHGHSSFVGLFDETLGVEEYRLLTQRLFGFYEPLDHAIGHVLKELGVDEIEYDYAPRAGFLAQDMADMNFSEFEIASSPRCTQISDIVTPTTLGGVLYVVEGATLGGSTIDRAAQKLLSAACPSRRRFWSWCRSENKRRWKLVNQYLGQLTLNDVTTDAVEAGAQNTFRVFADWLAPLHKLQPTDERKLQ